MIDGRAQVSMVIHIPEIKGIPSIPLGVFIGGSWGARGESRGVATRDLHVLTG